MRASFLGSLCRVRDLSAALASVSVINGNVVGGTSNTFQLTSTN